MSGLLLRDVRLPADPGSDVRPVDLGDAASVGDLAAGSVLTPSTRTDLALSTLLCVLLFAAVFMLGWWFGDVMSVSGGVR